jgi:ribosomal protein S24E
VIGIDTDWPKDWCDGASLSLCKAIDKEILQNIYERAEMANKEQDVREQATEELDKEEHETAVRQMKAVIREKRAMPFFTSVRKALAEILNPDLKKKSIPKELALHVKRDGSVIRTWYWGESENEQEVTLKFPVYKETKFLGDYEFQLQIVRDDY